MDSDLLDKTYKRNSFEISRREILSGGIATGFILSSGIKPSFSSTLKNIGHNLNAYVLVTADDKVSIRVPGAEIGQGIYTNLPKIVAEEMDADWGQVEVRMAVADPVYGNPAKDGNRQAIGSSDSVMGYFKPLQQMGAMAREMLVRAAAQKMSVPAEELSVQNGVIYHPTSGRKASFGELAGIASKISPPKEPLLKDRSNYKLLGKSHRRKDTPAKVDGSAVFGADISLPGKLFAALHISPVFGAKAVSDNRQEILNFPGVVAVADVEGGVAVIGDTFWQAKVASDSVKAEWDYSGKDKLDSNKLWQEMRQSLNDKARPFFPKGDAKGVIEKSSDVVELEYRVPFLAHACMEPLASTALVTDTSCHMWSPHQQQGAARTAAARITGLDESQVSLENTFAGGGFGRKWELDFAIQSVQAAMAVKGRPVSLIWTREQDIQNDFFRAAYIARIKGAFNEKGELVAMHSRLSGESLLQFQGRPRNFPDPTSVGGAVPRGYNIPDALIDYVEFSPGAAVGFWRGVALSQNGFFAESAIDEFAHHLGKDPYEFRRSLIPPNSRELKVLDRVAQMAGWGRDLPEGHGLGIAFCPGFGSVNAQVVEVNVSSGVLKVEKIWCAYDCGFPLDPSSVVHQMEGGIVYALSAALYGEITFKNGAAVQTNFHDYEMIRLSNMPELEIDLIESEEIIGGAGEAAVPATAPALANAVYAASGNRIRSLPISRFGLAVS